MPNGRFKKIECSHKINSYTWLGSSLWHLFKKRPVDIGNHQSSHTMIYHPEKNQHENGKSPVLIGDTPSNGCVSIVMLLFFGGYEFHFQHATQLENFQPFLIKSHFFHHPTHPTFHPTHPTFHRNSTQPLKGEITTNMVYILYIYIIYIYIISIYIYIYLDPPRVSNFSPTGLFLVVKGLKFQTLGGF